MSTDDIPLVFHTSSRLRRSELRSYLSEIALRIGRGTVSCIIATDQELRALNRGFLNKDYPTDVLSFPAAEHKGPATEPRRTKRNDLRASFPQREFLGDLAISVDRAREQAAEYGHTLHDELKILMLHGVLHLAGLDHETDQGEMRRAEIRWRKRLGLPVSLIERASSSRPQPDRARFHGSARPARPARNRNS